MKSIITFVLTICILQGFSQVTKMVQIRDQTFQMKGVQNDEPVDKSTKVFGLTINYETGELNGVVNLVDLDLLNKNREESADPEQDALKIKGFLPLNDILYNRQEQRTYKVELELKVKEFTVPVLFDFNIGFVKNTQSNFHNVRAVGPVNLLDFQIEDLNGFEPNVNILMSFQMVSLNR